MKKLLAIAALVAAGCQLFALGKKDSAQNRANKVVVYAYDSFAGEWGAAEQIRRLFEQETGYTLEIVNCGSAVQVVNKALAERDRPYADVLLGIDNNMADSVRGEGILAEYKPAGADSALRQGLHEALGADWQLTPYDYSHFALIYDTQSTVPEPASLSDLTRPAYRGKLILMDPRTSSTGLGFASWTVSVFGDGYAEYWRALKPSILSMTPGWSAGWGMFTKGEAPLVVSYVTSPASEVEYNHNSRYKALVFAQGHVMQVEGLGVLKDAPNAAGARAFVDFFISQKAQELLPLTQWMYPANKDAALPDSYVVAAPDVQNTLPTHSKETAAAVDTIIEILSR